jgi:hypothetical protein
VALNWVICKGALPIPWRQECRPGHGKRRRPRLEADRGGSRKT